MWRAGQFASRNSRHRLPVCPIGRRVEILRATGAGQSAAVLMVTRLAVNGLTDEQIARIVGWTAQRVSEVRARYVAKARRREPRGTALGMKKVYRPR